MHSDRQFREDGHMPLPTFVILGAQKCGTTTLSATFRHHPQIHVSRRKELHFFDRPKNADLNWYAEQFRPRPAHLAWGEATPSYIFLDSARRRIAEALPDARFIVMLRDPAKRAHSHFWHNHRLGVETTSSFEEALDLEAERLEGATRVQRTRYSYVARGRYVEQLQAMVELVGRDRLHVMLLEDLVTDRATTLQKVFEFLGVDPGPANDLPAQHVVPKSGKKGISDSYSPMAPNTRARLVEELAPSTRSLQAWLDRDLTPWLKA